MKRKLIALLLAVLTVCATSVTSLAANDTAAWTAVSAVGSKKKLFIREVDFDRHDNELEIEFNCRVKFKKPKIIVKTSRGKKLKVRIQIGRAHV